MDESRTYAGPAAGPEDLAEGAPDALDLRIDYEAIAARSEADRRAGRLVGQDEVERQAEAWLRAIEGERRSA